MEMETVYRVDNIFYDSKNLALLNNLKNKDHALIGYKFNETFDLECYVEGDEIYLADIYDNRFYFDYKVDKIDHSDYGDDIEQVFCSVYNVTINGKDIFTIGFDEDLITKIKSSIEDLENYLDQRLHNQ